MTSEIVGETKYVPVTFGGTAGVCDPPVRAGPGDPEDHDALRTARGVIWVTVFGIPFWSGVLLLLYWL